MGIFSKNTKPVVNLDQLEAEIAELHRPSPRDFEERETEPIRYLNEQRNHAEDELPPIEYYAPKTRIPAPAPVPVRQPTAEDLGRITAEAIKQAHEHAARSFELLGEEINARMLQIEQLKLQAQEQIAECKELAEQHREAGKLMSAQVDSAAADLNAARAMIDDMRKKMKPS